MLRICSRLESKALPQRLSIARGIDRRRPSTTDLFSRSMQSARQDRCTIDIVDFNAARTDEIVRLWRESFEFGVGVVDPHPIEEQQKAFVTTVVPNNAVRMALLGEARGFYRS